MNPVAYVDTTPEGVILRIRLLVESPTYTFPDESTATPEGPLKVARIPLSLVDPGEPLPANVDTTPKGVILRIRLLSVSATYICPDESNAIC